MITSLSNPKVARAVRLKKRALRERDRRFLVEGARLVEEAIGSDAGLEVLFHTSGSRELPEAARERGAAVLHVSQEVMGRLTATVTPQGIVGIAPFLDSSLEVVDPGRGCVLVLDSVRDPGNAGTALRSADASGAGAVVFSAGSVDVYNPKTVRASAGSLFHLPLVRDVPTGQTVEHLRGLGCRILAADPDGDEDLFQLDLSGPVAFLLGNEARGLSRDVASLADATVRVPTPGRAESLNLAAAATVLLFEWARQGRAGRQVALETLIAAVAHDIRSPLTAMKGFGYALQKRWHQMTDEQRTAMLAGILLDTDRMDTIVRQLLDAARVVSDQFDAFPERVGVKALVEDLAATLAHDPEHPGVVWEGSDATAFTDPDRLRTAVHAFVESSVWWAREGPVRVSASVRTGRLRLVARRAGAEIPRGDVERLFEPRRPGTGAGSKIGLFVTRGTAQAMGGSATAEVRDGEIVFTLELPASQPS